MCIFGRMLRLALAWSRSPDQLLFLTGAGKTQPRGQSYSDSSGHSGSQLGRGASWRRTSSCNGKQRGLHSYTLRDAQLELKED